MLALGNIEELLMWNWVKQAWWPSAVTDTESIVGALREIIRFMATVRVAISRALRAATIFSRNVKTVDLASATTLAHLACLPVPR